MRGQKQMSETTKKTLKEIFKDYNSNSFVLNNATIQSINLYKKTNTLELVLLSDKIIPVKDIAGFEKYLETRFAITTVEIKVKVQEEQEMSEEQNSCESAGGAGYIEKMISDQWLDIIAYMAQKHPMTRAFLQGSTIAIDGKSMNVFLSLKGKEFLTAKKFDAILQKVLRDIFGKTYQVSYIENISDEILQKRQEEQQRMQEEMILQVEKETMEAVAEKHKEKLEKKALVKETSVPAEPIAAEPKVEEAEEVTPLILGRNPNIKENLVKVADLSVDSGKIALEGEVIHTDSRELKNGKHLLMFDVYDGSSTITCKAFVEADKAKTVMGRIQGAKGIKISGTAQFDPFAKELGVIANVILETAGRKKEARMDNSKVKRVELHMHTQMSQMDAVTPVKDLIKRAMKWGMKSIAITDHGVVQAFPDAHKMLGFDNPDMKVIYGVEAYLVPDQTSIVSTPRGQDLHTTYCVLDLETTGLSFRTEKITEVGIMKVKDGEVIDEFECFVNPEKPIPQKVVEVTNITDDMVKDAETIDKVMPKILEFVGDSVLVAHNADFDIGFLKYNAKQLGLSLENTYIDTLRLAKSLFPEYKKYKLGMIAENLGITVEVAHRALDDVDTTVKVFRKMLEMLEEKGVKTIDDIDKIEQGKADYKKLPSYHAIILAKENEGIKNLYK